MQPHGNGEAKAGEQSGTGPASALLATQSPAALAALLATLHPALAERVEAVLWSAHWPQRLAARPAAALGEASATRAVRIPLPQRGLWVSCAMSARLAPCT